MAELETEHQRQLRELLRMKRQLLHEREMQIALGGIYVDPSVTLARNELKREVADIEARLGVVWPKAKLPRPTPPPPRPVEDFAREQEETRQRARQSDVRHHQELLRIHRSNLSHYREQARAFGGVELAPPICRHGMRESRGGVAQAKSALRALGVEVDDLPGDG